MSLKSQIAAVATLVSSACVYHPLPKQQVDVQGTEFNGFAYAPGATIEVEAYNNATERWDVLATAQASSAPVNYGGQTLYPWTTWVDFTINDDLEAWPRRTARCYFGQAWTAPDGDVFCPQAGGGIYGPLGGTRVTEVGGPLEHLTILEGGGVGCVTDLVGQGEDWFAAGLHCESNDNPVMELHGVNFPSY